jgi:hypothetical protein
MTRVGSVEKDEPGADLYAATSLVADVVVRQRAQPAPDRPVVDSLAAATIQHLAVLGELAEVLRDQVALVGYDPVRARDTAAALQAALSSAQLFTTELVRQLHETPMRHTA